jgi:hypothetical protein
MSNFNRVGREDHEFADGYLREFDTALLTMHPAQRAGYLESAYVQTLAGPYQADFLRQLARLLLKWSSSKRSFASHAHKLEQRAELIEAEAVNEPGQNSVTESDVRDLRGSSHTLVSKVLSSPPGPLNEEERE